jgi:hypothetical protein
VSAPCSGARPPHARLKAALAIALAAAGFAVPAAGQEVPHEPGPRRIVRAGVGAGIGSAGLAVAVEVAVHSGERLYKGRLTAHDNLGGGWAPGMPAETITELGVLYGTGHRFRQNYGLVAAGVALVTVDRTAGSSATVGIPVEAQLISARLPRIGVGVIGNLNPVRPFAALVVSLQLGGVPYLPPK